jgi:hypothetical protein
MNEWMTKYWLQTIFGAIVASITFFGKRKMRELECKLKEQEAIKMGMQALLRDRIIQSYNHYLEKGFCPIYARDNIQNLYNQYHNLGGNGTVTKLVEKLSELPTEPQEGKG